VTNNKAAEQMKKDGVKSLSTYLSCLLYLRQEARRDGLDAIANVLGTALNSIGNWLDTGKAPVRSEDMVDSQFCHTMEFLFRWMVLPLSEQRSVLQEINKFEEGLTMERAARQLRRVSKKTAN
jgi:hypothetical protein